MQPRRFSNLGFCFFLPHDAASGILVPLPGIEPRRLAVKAQSPDHLVVREFLIFPQFLCHFVLGLSVLRESIFDARLEKKKHFLSLSFVLNKL